MNKMSSRAAVAALNGRSNVEHFPGDFPILGNESDDPAVRQPGFWARRAVDLKLKTMSDAPQKPYWNTTMVSAWCAVAGAIILILSSIAGLYIYTRTTSLEEGRRLGAAEAEQRNVAERLAIAETELRRVKDLKLIEAGQNAGHPTQELKK